MPTQAAVTCGNEETKLFPEQVLNANAEMGFWEALEEAGANGQAETV